MPKMSALELRDLLTAQRWDSMCAITASRLSEERATSLDYYQGDMSKYMPAPAGRSKAVSMDTSDTIEGMMPTLMDIFAGGDEVVRFDPVGPQDVPAARQVRRGPSFARFQRALCEKHRSSDHSQFSEG